MKLYEILAAEYKEIFPSSREKLGFVDRLLKKEKLQRILDIGCASGEFASQLSSPKREVTGIDLDVLMIKEAKAQYGSLSESTLQFYQADMLRFLADSDADQFDLISCLGNTIVYLYGVTELKGFLLFAQKSLKNQGKMIIQILNYSNPSLAPGFTFPDAETADIKFTRKYVALKNSEKWGFKTAIKDKSTGKTETDLHHHFPFKSSRIAEMAQEAGFTNTQIYGGYDGKEAEVSDFFHLIVLEN